MKQYKGKKDYLKQISVLRKFIQLLNEKYGEDEIKALANQAYSEIYGTGTRADPHPCDPERKCSVLYHCLQCDPGEPI